MKGQRVIRGTQRASKHKRYVTTDGQICPGGSTIARVVAFGSPDYLLRWAVRCAETCEVCGKSIIKICHQHGEVNGMDHNLVKSESGDFGTCFHRIVECRSKGIEFNADAFPGAYVDGGSRMADNFFRELDKLGLVVLDNEVEHTSDALRTGGTLDLILASADEPEIPLDLGDLKSSNFVSGEHVLQVGGVYREIFKEVYGRHPRKVWLFRADKDNFKVDCHEIPEDMIIAAAESVEMARRMYDLRRRMERRF